MASEGVNDLTQAQLAAVLRYFAHGDFARFTRAAEIVFGAPCLKKPYFCADLLFALHIGGLCEVSNASGVTQWWASHSGDVHINSMSPKQIGVTSQWFSAHENWIAALITDPSKSPLLMGSLGDDMGEGSTSSVFDRAFDSLVPPFVDIEHQLCVEVAFRDDLSGALEVFDPSVGRWNDAAPDHLAGSQLIRTRREYSGLDYYVQHSTLALRFRITQPDWAFVVAYHVLPWTLSSILTVDGTRVCINRAVRLPTLLYRTLFAACQAVRIGPVVTFEGVDARCIRGILSYFSEVGERR